MQDIKAAIITTTCSLGQVRGVICTTPLFAGAEAPENSVQIASQATSSTATPTPMVELSVILRI